MAGRCLILLPQTYALIFDLGSPEVSLNLDNPSKRRHSSELTKEVQSMKLNSINASLLPR